MKDEVSMVLHHFKPKPEFAVKSEFGSSLGSSSRTRKSEHNGFSSLRYDGSKNSLIVTYPHGRTLILKFEVSTMSPYSITCVPDGGSASAIKVLKLEELCASLSTAKDFSNASLFYVVSKLLQSLHALPPYDNSDSSFSLVNNLLRSPKVARNIDLGILLLRCAAASRRSTTLCTPLPLELRGLDFIANHIFALTNRINTSRPAMIANGSTTSDEQSFLFYLLSLPFTELGTQKIIQNNTDEKEIHTGRTVCLCLDIGNAIGDESPRFTSLAKLHGVKTVFHGTNPENTWSILNYGLQNLSDTSLSENGAIMGKGVYFSTSYDVAAFFAKTNSTKCNNVPWWRHPSLLSLLNINYSGFNIDDFMVSFYPVFEAQILAPAATTLKNGVPAHNGSSSLPSTRCDGKYFVVPDNEDMRMTKLYLNFELVRKWEGPSQSVFWFFLILAIGVAFLMKK